LSARRLADEQPDSFTFSEESLERAKWWIAKFPEGRQQSAVIPLLWLVQKQEGWVPERALRVVADLLKMPVIRVMENVTFYTMFQLEPAGSTAHIQLCGTTPCMLCGAGELKHVLEQVIGPAGGRSKDGRFSWEEVECMGACANAPMVAINDLYYEDLTPKALAQLIAEFASGAAPEPGSYGGRKGCEPVGGPLTLKDPALIDGSRARPLGRLPNMPEAAKG
jgi:NADH-quinone oxidoreductase subunit E